jgi:hypothetical protein
MATVDFSAFACKQKINDVVTITADDYKSSTSPPILPVTIEYLGEAYVVAIGPYVYGVDYTMDPITLTNGSSVLSISFPLGTAGEQGPFPCGDTQYYFQNAQSTQVTMLLSNDNSYIPGDTYAIDLVSCCGSNTGNFIGTVINFTRAKRMSINSTNSTNSTNFTDSTKKSPCIGCPCLASNTYENIQVPIVSFTGQTLVDGSDVGDMIFTICDEFTYYKEDDRLCCDKNCCSIVFLKPDEIKQTIFRKCCPLMVSVVEGKGETLYDKAFYLHGTEAVTISFHIFYNNLILYGMEKYILSRLIYGNFNINYLLRKYNERFLKDLEISRFCNSLPLFLSPNSVIYGYDKYFKYNQCKQ